jgi:hypothetical protein
MAFDNGDRLATITAMARQYDEARAEVEWLHAQLEHKDEAYDRMHARAQSAEAELGDLRAEVDATRQALHGVLDVEPPGVYLPPLATLVARAVELIPATTEALFEAQTERECPACGLMPDGSLAPAQAEPHRPSVGDRVRVTTTVVSLAPNPDLVWVGEDAQAAYMMPVSVGDVEVLSSVDGGQQ